MPAPPGPSAQLPSPPQAQGELLPLADTVLQAAVFLRPREEELRGGSVHPADAPSPLAGPGGPPGPGAGGCPLPAVSPGSGGPGGALRGGVGRGDPRGDAGVRFQEPSAAGMEGSTNDISHYIGLLDPWYERNVLGLMNLPMDVLCQVRVCHGRGGPCPFPGELPGEPPAVPHGHGMPTGLLAVSGRFPSPAGWGGSCGWR